MSTLLTRDQILKAQDIKTERVEVPEWGGAVMVRCMTGAARDAFEASLVDAKGKSRRDALINMRARIVSLSVVDDKGNALFSEADVTALGNKNAGALDRIFETAQRLSRLSPADMEVMAKNSVPDQSAASISA